MAPVDGALDGDGEIRISLRCAGLSSEVHARWASMVTISPAALQAEGSLLAIRRLGYYCGSFRCGGGVPFAVDEAIPTRRPGR
jgi:hypothetical protein